MPRRGREKFSARFLSTLSLRRATRPPALINLIIRISIHALLAESDEEVFFQASIWDTYFYPRSPCGERRMALALCFYLCWYFYPRSPCGERPCWNSSSRLRRQYFYPRSPCGERPLLLMAHPVGRKISIHALLAESDWLPYFPMEQRNYFYPRSPCGERRPSCKRW